VSGKKIWGFAFILAFAVNAISRLHDLDFPHLLGATLSIGVIFGVIGMRGAWLVGRLRRETFPANTPPPGV